MGEIDKQAHSTSFAQQYGLLTFRYQQDSENVKVAAKRSVPPASLGPQQTDWLSRKRSTVRDDGSATQAEPEAAAAPAPREPLSFKGSHRLTDLRGRCTWFHRVPSETPCERDVPETTGKDRHGVAFTHFTCQGDLRLLQTVTGSSQVKALNNPNQSPFPASVQSTRMFHQNTQYDFSIITET